ncbi:hypothetical protein COCSUDRAFT_65050 [Coccomyxa subellipsoidea C-169]|uniref:Pre-rRNA-processing protein TSR2 n=1 Tax=Coccomyxa subellipsoidea (strain C-169) TaxID=574566 RepID=I0Z2X5_COCSC|nr:hypothetical protein COCSUDRAFT_65050 [Coccomyxa subellipsoidea C-169]EIE24994.1 hypothetical protein COCSUDRAFT_65050 [Coccomyxa subellipsoidea C-169]|eukprot:XP_005649538.1 hypothetical protein COCSUDRAFT_65050 [Coccomyxa subellipsoidea C-169]
MLLRNGALSGGSTGQLPPEARPLFEEGATLVFRRWTALSLAVEGQWGGASSVEKAENIWAETMEWFYKNKEHYSDDLGMELEDSMEQDFNMKLEDGSPYEVAKVLVLLHSELLARNEATLNRLRQSAPLPPTASRQERVDRDGTVLAGDGEASSSDSDSDMDEDGMEATPSDAVQPAQRQGPVIDEEGFELVQKRRPRGRDKG